MTTASGAVSLSAAPTLPPLLETTAAPRPWSVVKRGRWNARSALISSKLTIEQRKQLLELLEAQDQQALQETEWHRQKYIKTANENGGGKVYPHDIGLG